MDRPPLTPSSSSSPALSRHVSRLDLATNPPYSSSMVANSQIAWLAGLNPHFDSPTGDQKFLRKVSRHVFLSASVSYHGT